MPSHKDRRQQRKTRAVVNAMRPLTEREEAAVLLAIAQCATDLQDNRPAEASAIPPEELVLCAAYNVATLARPRSLFVDALNLSAEEVSALCGRLRDAAEHVASRQGRGVVLDRFKVLDVTSNCRA